MSEEQPQVSILMLARNESQHIDAAIRSVMAQTVTDLEIIVIDGMSTDDTAEIVNALAAEDPRVRLVSNPQRTIPQGLNIGMRAARGRYVARCDTHSVLSRDYLKVALGVLEADPAIGSVGGRRVGTADTASGRAVATALTSKFGVGDAFYHYSDQATDSDHATFGVMRSNVLRSIGGWDERLLVNEDVDLDYRIHASGYRIRFEPRMAVFWRVRESAPEFAHQYRRYGRGKAAMVRKNGPRAVRWRHLVPPGLILALLTAAVLLITGPWWAAAVLAAPYPIAVATISALTTARPRHVPHIVSRPVEMSRPVEKTCPPPGTGTGGACGSSARTTARTPTRTGPAVAGPSVETLSYRISPLRLASAFMAMHLSWGVGFLEGLLLHRRPADTSAWNRSAPGEAH